jgi:hypothetical protein
MSPDEAKIHFTLPQLMNLLVKIIVVDPLDSFLIRSRFSQLARRRIFNTAGFMGVAFCMAPVYAIARYEAQSQHTTTVFLTTALLSGAMGFYALLPAGFKANYLEVTVEHTGIVSAVGNTLGSVASFGGPKFVGAVLEWHSERKIGCIDTGCDQGWNLVLQAIFVCNVVASTAFAVFSTVTPIEQ